MTTINLLTSEFAPKESVVRFSRYLRTLTIIAFVVLVVAITLFVSIFLINKGKINASVANQERLKNSIISFQKQEQSYVFAKDRATKIKQVFDVEDSIRNVNNFENLIAELPEGVRLSSIELTSNKSEMKISIGGLSNMLSLFKIIIAQDAYDGLKLESFSYNPNSGYSLGLTYSN